MNKKKILIIAAAAAVVIIGVIIALICVFNNKSGKTVVDTNIAVEVYFGNDVVADAGSVVNNKVTVDTSKIAEINNGSMQLADIENLGYEVVSQDYNQLIKVFISKHDIGDAPVGSEVIYTYQTDYTGTPDAVIEDVPVETTAVTEITITPDETEVSVETTMAENPVQTTKPATTTKPVSVVKPEVTTAKPAQTTAKPVVTTAITTKPQAVSTVKLAGVTAIDATSSPRRVYVDWGEFEGQTVFPLWNRYTSHGEYITYPGLVYDTGKSVESNMQNFSDLIYKASGGDGHYDLDTHILNGSGSEGCSLWYKDGYWRLYMDSHRNNFHNSEEDGMQYMCDANMFLQALTYFGGKEFGENLWCIFDEYCWVIEDNDYTQPIDDKILNKYGFSLVEQGRIGKATVTGATWKYGNKYIVVDYPCDNNLGIYASTAINVWFPMIGSDGGLKGDALRNSMWDVD